ncbi:ASKHA domain-containing protein [Chloroflexota bacterium]
MKTHSVIFEPIGRKAHCREDESVLACAQRLGVGIVALCGGKGKCHSCRVQLLAKTIPKPTCQEMEVFSQEEIAAGWRLACQTRLKGDCRINVPSDSLTTLQRTQVEGPQVKVRPEPVVKAYEVRIPRPSLSDPRADANRFLQALNQQHHLKCRRVDLDTLHQISPKLRDLDWECQATVRDDEVIALAPFSNRQLGLAIDLGTTKIAGYLVDLSDGRTMTYKGMMNPQINYGEDVISRMSYALGSQDASLHLQRLSVEAIGELAISLCRESGTDGTEIADAVVVGNTAMHHLFLGLPVEQLACSPYVPAVSMALDIKARDLGLAFSPGAYIHCPPNIAGFVGADHVAMLLATGALKMKGLQLAIDIGTNTEISLVKDGHITSISCASGPAFEGVHIKHGMRAASGAIERIRVLDDKVESKVIDDAVPLGICGSGILDVVSELYRSGIISARGLIEIGHPLVRSSGDNQREFVLVNDQARGGKPAIVVTQHDIREIQLAKGAIRTGIEQLLRKEKCTKEQLDKIIIAGAFGSHINIDSAMTIGMLPLLPLERFEQVGNAAGIGAKLALISGRKRREAQEIASRVSYVELSSDPEFMNTFVNATCIAAF